jgi:hypothetical protein
MNYLSEIFCAPPGFNFATLQLHADTYGVINMKPTTNWKKQLTFKQGTSNVLINSQTKMILCWGQVIGDVCHWVPVDFKTPEAAQDWLNEGSIPELKRVVQAPVEWRKEFIGPIPPPDPLAISNISTVTMFGSPTAPAPQVQANGSAGQPPAIPSGMTSFGVR